MTFGNNEQAQKIKSPNKKYKTVEEQTYFDLAKD